MPPMPTISPILCRRYTLIHIKAIYHLESREGGSINPYSIVNQSNLICNKVN